MRFSRGVVDEVDVLDVLDVLDVEAGGACTHAKAARAKRIVNICMA